MDLVRHLFRLALGGFRRTIPLPTEQRHKRTNADLHFLADSQAERFTLRRYQRESNDVSISEQAQESGQLISLRNFRSTHSLSLLLGLGSY